MLGILVYSHNNIGHENYNYVHIHDRSIFQNNQDLLADVCFCASIIKSNGGFEPLSKRS